ncbi:MAG: SusC/RagA family TonB-linked outer membrane protein, partial [Bacteroidales bacterium]|nr:SusC/RagA family TonB-linked outer membrane protein [Bacteroidales bacterium]
MKKFVQSNGTYEESYVNPGIYKKMFLIMRLTMILMFFAAIQVSAKGYAQITLSAKNESMQKVFKEIQKQSGYDFLYSYELLQKAGTITVDIKDAPIKEAVNECIKGKNLTFTIVDNTVIVKAKSGEVQQPVKYTLTGKVTDLKGVPIAGVSIIIKGTKNGVATEKDGTYIMNLPVNQATLVVSFIGMKSKEVIYSGQKVINIRLEDDILEINQAVVIGYGTTTKLEATDAMSSIDPKIFAENSASTLTEIVQGQVPGMLTMMGTGAPGEEALAIVRGVSTLNGNMIPLIVIDDIPMHEDFQLNEINPNDIKSINILKGASATSIYGSRGAAGVFMITTKGGLNTLPQVNYKFNYGITTLAEQMAVLNSDEFKQLFIEAIVNRAIDESMMSNTGLLVDITTGTFGKNYYNKYFNDPTYWGESETDWLGAMYQPASVESHNILLTGNAAGIGYSLGVGMSKDKGMVKKTGFDRKNLTIRVDSRQNSFFQFGMNLTGSLQDQDSPTVTLDKAMFMRPDLPIYNDDGTFYIPGGGFTMYYQNPLAELEGMDNNSNSLTYTVSGYGQFNFTKDLSWKTLYSYSTTDSHSERYYGSKTLIGSNNFRTNLPRSGRLIRGENQRSKEEFDSRLTYKKTIDKIHNLDAMLAFTTVTNSYYSLSQTYDDFPEDNVLNAPWYGLNRDIKPSGSMTESAMLSYLGRINYNYDNKYLTTVSYRMDGTSRMSPDSRYQSFPSIAFAWNISEEDFIKKYDDLFKLLKFRASYGVMANATVPEYGWRTMFEAIQYDNQQSIRPLQLGNENLEWEMTHQYDIGLDFAL